MNVANPKKIVSEEKTWLPSLRKQNCKTVKTETKKISELLKHISKNNITKLNELIYAGAKLICEKIGLPFKNTNRNSKPGWEIRLEMQIRNQRQQAKMTEGDTGRCWYEKKKKATQIKQTIQLMEINQKVKLKEDLKDIETGLNKTEKTEHPKTTKGKSINKLGENAWRHTINRVTRKWKKIGWLVAWVLWQINFCRLMPNPFLWK